MTPRGTGGPVTPDDLDPILVQVTIPLPIAMVYQAFIDVKQLSTWLSDGASVVPEVGGRYELRFDEEPAPFTSRGTILRLAPEHELEFEWIPSPLYEPAVRASKAGRSTVYVRFQESPEGIDVTLEHDGWPDSDPGAEARGWHFRFWDERLTELKAHLLKTAYG